MWVKTKVQIHNGVGMLMTIENGYDCDLSYH